MALRTLTAAELEQLQAAETLLQQAEKIKDSRSTLAGLFTFGRRRLFLKRHNARNFYHRLRRKFQTPRPLRNLAVTLRLNAIGIPAPQILLAMRTFRHSLPEQDYLITEALPSPLTAAEQFELLWDRDAAAIDALAALAARIHAAGVFHGDLKLPNVICRMTGDQLCFGLFDFDGSQLYGKALAAPERRLDLARLAASWRVLARQTGAEPEAVSVADCFAEAYRRHASLSLAGPELNARVTYLSERVRKH